MMWIKEAFETNNVFGGQELSALISNVSVLFSWLYDSIKYVNHYCLLAISYKLKVFVLSVLQLISSIRRYGRSGMQPVKSVWSILDFDLKARVLPSLERESWRARSSHPEVFCKKNILTVRLFQGFLTVMQSFYQTPWRSSNRRCSKKGVLKNFAKFFFSKVAGLRRQRNLQKLAVEILKVKLGLAPGNMKNAIPEAAAQRCS